ncbi:MAG: hypothetical protein Q8R40_02440 [bacterium]|nr:hypothetical protein [bacterium]
MNPYIGITGFMNKDEVLAVLNSVPQNSKYRVMVGVLASSHTINGISNKWPHRYPKPEHLNNIFQRNPKALNLIHFNTKEPQHLYEQMMHVRRLAGPCCHGFQLNVAWPNPAILRRVALKGQRTVIVLQVGGHAFEMINHSPQELAQKVASEYAGLIDYVLLDPSGGYGKQLDTDILKGYLRALTAKQLSIGLGVAGGLSPATLHLIAPLVDEFPDLSIDAEGRLRDEHDHMEINIVISYLLNAIALFEGR